LIDNLMNILQGSKKKKGEGMKGKAKRKKRCGLKEMLTKYGTQKNEITQEEIMKMQRTK